MRISNSLCCSVLIVGLLSGCEKNDRAEKDEAFRKARQNVAASEPAPVLEVGRMVKPAEVLNSQEAMAVPEIATMLRARVSEPELIETIRSRGMIVPLDDGDAAALAHLGASPGVLNELRNLDNVLTPNEYQRYLGRKAQRADEKAAISGNLRQQDADREWAQSKENARLERLNDQIQYNADRDRAEQERQRAATAYKLERESREADWKNSNNSPHGVDPYYYYRRKN